MKKNFDFAKLSPSNNNKTTMSSTEVATHDFNKLISRFPESAYTGRWFHTREPELNMNRPIYDLYNQQHRLPGTSFDLLYRAETDSGAPVMYISMDAMYSILTDKGFMEMLRISQLVYRVRNDLKTELVAYPSPIRDPLRKLAHQRLTEVAAQLDMDKEMSWTSEVATAGSSVSSVVSVCEK